MIGILKCLAKGQTVDDEMSKEKVGKDIGPGRLDALKKGIQLALETYTETSSDARKIVEDDGPGGLENFGRL